ncbi:hypothetical protein POM88_002262 [Heracleum sosnowskyi]|uniref:Response regulatory domain-containing protein n=1 Tax=Heracleum sosnowskyi TaxID=360622 RepID=A0AAD8JHN3_9APIA|nr:hypothetical protein POM88_002262 [Heracleum sosnowskyi]
MEISFNNDKNNAQRSSEEKKINILVVDHDMVSLVTTAGMMKKCSYGVVTARDCDLALCSLGAKNIKFDLVVVEVHMPDMNGFKLQQLIYRDYQLPVILISFDKEARDSWKPSENGAVSFLLKPLPYEDVIKFPVYVEQWKNQLKFKISKSSSTNRNKVVWTKDLHLKFERAIQFLEPKRCVPRYILEIMDEPELTREQVNSHLQKFRQWQKKSLKETRTIQPDATDERLQGFGHSSMLRPSDLQIQPGFPPISSLSTTGVGGANNIPMMNPQHPSANWPNGHVQMTDQLWDKTHTTMESRKAKEKEPEKELVYPTPAAMEVAGRYGAILEREGVELTPGTEFVEPLEWWLQATTNETAKPPKDAILGFRHVQANRLLKNLAHRHRQSTNGGAGSSSAPPNRPSNIPDLVFVQVVRLAISEAQANPSIYLKSLENRELEGLAWNLLQVINLGSMGNINSTFFREVAIKEAIDELAHVKENEVWGMRMRSALLVLYDDDDMDVKYGVSE